MTPQRNRSIAPQCHEPIQTADVELAAIGAEKFDMHR